MASDYSIVVQSNTITYETYGTSSLLPTVPVYRPYYADVLTASYPVPRITPVVVTFYVVVKSCPVAITAVLLPPPQLQGSRE